MSAEPTLPVIHCMYGTRRGQIASIIFSFGAGQEALREEIMGRLKRVMEGPPAMFGEVTVQLGHRGEALAELQRPCNDDRIIGSIVRALAKEKFQLVFDGVIDEDKLAQELLHMLGLDPIAEEPPSPN